MADESFQEKTEAPTPKRRRDAREEGQIPRSQEVTTALTLLAAAAVLSAGLGGVVDALGSFFGYATQSFGAAGSMSLEGSVAWLRTMGWRTLSVLAPVVLPIAGVALLVGAVQAQGVLSTKPLEPKLERISPLANMKKIWGIRSLAELAKSLLKLTLVGVVVYATISHAAAELGALPQESPMALGAMMRRYAVRLLLTAGLAYLGLAVADYLYQVWQHERSLRMSREEVKREMKEQEGDMMVKARRRSMGRSLARQRMFKDVPDADVVITNPTHVAVALRYDPETSPAPVILAMGQRKIAQRIKAIAFEYAVPVVENKPLARALLATGRVGEAIPGNLYVAVAEVLAFVIRRHGGLGTRRNWTVNA